MITVMQVLAISLWRSRQSSGPTITCCPLSLDICPLPPPFQGIGWLHFLYLLGTWFNLLFGSILTIYGLSSGRAGVALFSLIIGPLFFIISTIVLRVLVEVLLSVLMVPHLLHTTTAQPTPPTFNMTPLPTMAAAPPLNTTNPFSTEASPPEEVDRMAV